MSISRRQRRRIFARDRFACYWCDARVTIGHNATLEHVVPRSHGGSNRMDNLVTACKPCNEARGDHPGPPPGSVKPLPSREVLAAASIEPPPFPGGVLLVRGSPQWKSYRRWYRKKGFWLYHPDAPWADGEVSEAS